MASNRRALVIGGPRAKDMLPKVPDLLSVLPDSEYVSWQALFAPAGTPAPIVDRLNAELARVLRRDGDRLHRLTDHLR